MSTEAQTAAGSSSLATATAAPAGAAPAKAHRNERGRGFATRGNYFTVDDVVWARPPKYPFWPAEIVEVLDEAASKFRVRLLNPPTAALAELPSVHGGSMFFFDHLADDAQMMKVIDDRLNRDRHDVSAYEDSYIAAVRSANELVRVVLNPDWVHANPRHQVVCKPVGVVHCYHRTHTSAPRQPHTGEVAAPALGVIKFARGFENALRDLKGFERIWVTFHFSYATTFSDLEDARGFSYMVVPPRDTVARGVFATRSPHRPNSIGLSCIRLVDVRGLELHIADHDLLHGTPVLDVKPYLPFCDAHPNAKAGWVDTLNASGLAKGDHRAGGRDSAPDVALVRNYKDGAKPRTIDAFSGLPVPVATGGSVPADDDAAAAADDKEA